MPRSKHICVPHILSNGALELGILGLVDNSHASAAELLKRDEGTPLRGIVSLPYQQELACLHEISCLEAVQVNTAGESRPVEANFMVASFLFTAHELCHQLA